VLHEINPVSSKSSFMRINAFDFTIFPEKHSPTTLAEIYSNVTILRSDNGIKIISTNRHVLDRHESKHVPTLFNAVSSYSPNRSKSVKYIGEGIA